MAAGGLYQNLILDLNLSHPPRDAKNVMPPRFEEEPNGDTEHLMPPARRWGGFNSD